MDIITYALCKKIGSNAKEIAQLALDKVESIPQGVKFKGSCTYAELSQKTSTASVGDMWRVTDKNNMNYLFDGSNWLPVADHLITSVNNKVGNVVLKTSDIENDSNYVTSAQLITKQDKLTAGKDIVIDENNVINATTKTYRPLKAAWKQAAVYGQLTLAEFCGHINEDSSVSIGDAYGGNINSSKFFEGLYLEDPDEPLESAEVNVQILSNWGTGFVQLLTVTSSNHAPFMWQYTWVDGLASWVSWTDVRKLNSSETTNTLNYLSLNGTEYKIGGANYTAGNNITISADNVISATVLDNAASIIVKDDITVGTTVGGLTQGMSLKNMSVADIIRTLVNGSAPATGYKTIYTGSIPVGTSINNLTINGNITYSGSDTPVSTRNYDTIGSVKVLTTNNTKQGIIISKDELEDIQFMQTSDMDNWTHSIRSFADQSTTQIFHVYVSNMAVGDFSYVLIKKTTPGPTPVVTDYATVYSGWIPDSVTPTGLTTEGVISYNGGTNQLTSYSNLGTIKVVSSTPGQAIILSKSELQDIQFMSISEIEDWTHTTQTFVDGSKTQMYHVYTIHVAAGTFMYTIS